MTKPTICDRCGAEFGCDREAGKDRCWCEDVPAVLPVPKDGKAACLCPKCLKALAAAMSSKR
ncbi:MAG: cysteine-rich CWC family protein [Elusimicrobia bacterium]|nr:cysteine-rich CWC family protein [Elusimicrobiota bacterium]